MEDYIPIEKPGKIKNFGSSFIRFKDKNNTLKKLGDKEEPKSIFERLRDKDENKHMEGLREVKFRHSKNKDKIN
jgi:hypothetical protein